MKPNEKSCGWNEEGQRGSLGMITKSPKYHLPELETVSFKNFEGLPDCVASYLRSVITDGEPLIKDTFLRQVGEFRLKQDGRWYPFEAEQSFTTNPANFIWNARIRMFPLTRVHVQDSFVNGHGSMQAKIFGLVPIVNQHDTHELDTAALQRYLAEAAWFPTMLLPGDRLIWSELDTHRAMATLHDSGLTASLEFDFNENNEITGVFSPGRYSYSKGKYERVPWAGQFRNYQKVGQVRIPTEAEVEWIQSDQPFSYFRGKIEHIEFNRQRIECEACC